MTNVCVWLWLIVCVWGYDFCVCGYEKFNQHLSEFCYGRV